MFLKYCITVDLKFHRHYILVVANNLGFSLDYLRRKHRTNTLVLSCFNELASTSDPVKRSLCESKYGIRECILVVGLTFPSLSQTVNRNIYCSSNLQFHENHFED